MGFLLFALCRLLWQYWLLFYTCGIKRISFSYNYCPWHDGYIFYSCYGSCLEPFVKQRSNIDVVPVVDSYEGDVYYYNGYSTAVVYYTGHKVIKINGDESRWDDRDKLKNVALNGRRNILWNK